MTYFKTTLRFTIFEHREMEETVVHQDKIFTHVDYGGKKLRNREFIRCEFIGCDFNKSDLKGNAFEDCSFKQCNFTMADVDNVGFRNAIFVDCKILGLDFTRCNTFAFSFSFTDCYLDYSIFYGTKLRKTVFKNCSLKDVEFSEADLTGSSFENCDLSATRFANTNLEKVDFSTAQNFAIDPESNKLKKAKFSALNLAGLLYKYNLDIDYDGA